MVKGEKMRRWVTTVSPKRKSTWVGDMASCASGARRYAALTFHFAERIEDPKPSYEDYFYRFCDLYWNSRRLHLFPRPRVSQCARCRKLNISLRRALCQTTASIQTRLERSESFGSISPGLFYSSNFESYMGDFSDAKRNSDPPPPSLCLEWFPPKKENKERPMESVE